MPELSDTAVCLRCWDWSETSQTVALFTRNAGLLRGLAKGSRRERSSFSGGFEPMTLGGLRAFTKANSDLATLASWDLADPWRGLRTDLGAHYAGCYLVDLVYHALPPEDPHPRLFDATAAALARIAQGLPPGDDLDRVMAVFHAVLLEELGYQPDLDRSALGLAEEHPEGLAFDPAQGRMCRAEDAHGRPVWGMRGATHAYLVGLFAAIAPEQDESTAPHLIGPEPTPDTGVVGRAARFLVCQTGVAISRVVPSLRFVYPETPGRIEDWVGSFTQSAQGPMKSQYDDRQRPLRGNHAAPGIAPGKRRDHQTSPRSDETR